MSRLPIGLLGQLFAAKLGLFGAWFCSRWRMELTTITAHNRMTRMGILENLGDRESRWGKKRGRWEWEIRSHVRPSVRSLLFFVHYYYYLPQSRSRIGLLFSFIMNAIPCYSFSFISIWNRQRSPMIANGRGRFAICDSVRSLWHKRQMIGEKRRHSLLFVRQKAR